jgi:hypothetical protein
MDDVLNIGQSKTAQNNSNIVVSQFNEGTVNISLTPTKFRELYDLVEKRK